MDSKKNSSSPKPIDPGRRSQRERKQMGRGLERSRSTTPHRAHSEADDAARGHQEPRRDENKES
jgi:hypothetical protein